MTSYRIRGLDGREYGPVDLENLTRWIREGRIVAAMGIQIDGVGDWKPANQVTELTPLFMAPVPTASTSIPPAAVTPPASPPYSAAVGGPSVAPRDTPDYGPKSFVASDAQRGTLTASPNANLSIGFVFGRAFELFDWVLLGQAVVISILSGVTFGIVLVGPLMVGFATCCLRKVDGKPFEFGDLFRGFDNFGHGLLAHVIWVLVMPVAWACCLVPGLFLTVKWWYWTAIMADNPGRGALECLTDSWNLTEGRFFEFLALGIVSMAVLFAGLCACIVGFWPATVVVGLASAVAFRQLIPAKSS